MKSLTRIAAAAAALTSALALPALGLAAPAGAETASPHVVFVQDDNPAGNTVYAYDRATDGSLSLAGSYASGGAGGVLAGSVVDHLASQGGLALDSAHDLLFAVNAGSDTVSVFGVDGDRLALRQILPSGGSFPVSVAVSGDLAYVLDARDGGAISGYRVDHRHVQPIARSTRSLGLDEVAPEFTHTPGQVLFSRDGEQLLVTTKAASSSIDVFALGPDGRPAASPVVDALPGTVPFAAVWDRAGHLVVSQAGTNSVSTFALAEDGTLTGLGSYATHQAATCWIAAAGDFLYASNAGSASLSGVRTASDGAITSAGTTSVDAGTVDAAASPDGRFLYVQGGKSGVVDALRVNGDGSLSAVGSVTVPDAAGAEGIAVS